MTLYLDSEAKIGVVTGDYGPFVEQTAPTLDNTHEFKAATGGRACPLNKDKEKAAAPTFHETLCLIFGARVDIGLPHATYLDNDGDISCTLSQSRSQIMIRKSNLQCSPLLGSSKVV